MPSSESCGGVSHANWARNRTGPLIVRIGDGVLPARGAPPVARCPRVDNGDSGADFVKYGWIGLNRGDGAPAAVPEAKLESADSANRSGRICEWMSASTNAFFSSPARHRASV